MQPNGTITDLVKSGGEITDVKVKWLSDEPEFEFLLVDNFEGNWETNFPNTWWLEVH